MNLMHLKYAVEVERAGSINKAADNLYMGQPNLSRAIKDLESSLGIIIFDRSSRGMVPTPEGEEFLSNAKKILREVDEIEAIYRSGLQKKQAFSISVPRASYISYAFANFTKHIQNDKPAEIFYKETNALRTIKNIVESDYHLGIIRYASNYDQYFKEMLEEKGLRCEIITEFTYRIIISARHPLASKEILHLDDLKPFMEIAHGDPFVPSMPMAAARKEELPDDVDRRIYIFERGSQFELLSKNTETFMWVSPVPAETLEKYGLIEKKCSDNQRKYKDMLICKKDYRHSELDKIFITELCNAKRKFLG